MVQKHFFLLAAIIFVCSSKVALTSTNYTEESIVKIATDRNTENSSTFNVDNGSYGNNGIISIGYEEIGIIGDDRKTNVGNAVMITGGNSLKNTGVISGKVSLSCGETTEDLEDSYAYSYAVSYNSGNGAYNYSNGSINNIGIIRGDVQLKGGVANSIGTLESSSTTEATAYDSGNGITVGDFAFENSDIANIGIISGDVVLNGGESHSTGIVGTNINAASSAQAMYSGNGVQKSYSGGNITNSGVIAGSAILEGGNSFGSGSQDVTTTSNAQAMYSGNGIIGEESSVIENNGVVKGSAILSGGRAEQIDDSNPMLNAYASATSSANGVFMNGKITNSGILEGSALLTNGETSSQPVTPGVWISQSANGIYGNNDIINNGVIRGYMELINSESNNTVMYSGNGIALFRGDISNSGVIMGSESAVLVDDSSSFLINNHGIMVGQRIFSDATNQSIDNQGTNRGAYLYLLADGSVTNMLVAGSSVGNNIIGVNGTSITDVINAGNGIKVENGSTLTGVTNTYLTINSGNNSYSNSIINGAGITSVENGNATLNVSGATTTLALNNTIINAYETALIVNDAIVNATDTIFNGGGLKNEIAVIEMENSSYLNITGNSIINGDVEISGTGSKLAIDNNVQVNGNLKDNTGMNILNLGSGIKSSGTLENNGYYYPEETNGLKLYHKIEGFKNIDIAGRVIAYETANITSGDIYLNNGSEFVVRVDGSKTTELLKDSNGNNAVIGHALYNHNGSIEAEKPEDKNSFLGPQLIFKTNGLGDKTIIVFDGTGGGGVTDLTELNDFQIDTFSKLTTAIKTSDGKNILLTYNIFKDIIGKDTDDDDDYGLIWNSINNSGQLQILLNSLENKSDEVEEMLSLLDQIYANNPYVQATNLSYDNLALFRKSIFDTKMPELKEWIIEGHGVYAVDKDPSKDRLYNRGDIIIGNYKLNNQYKVNLETEGLLATAEYGIAERTSLGISFGGSNQKANMSRDTKLKGDAVYLGAYGKKKIKDFTLLGGIGYQYGMYKGTRTTISKYQDKNSEGMQNKGDIKINSFEIYGEAKYTIMDSKGRKIEPKLRLIETYVMQGNVSEDNAPLAIDMDKKNYTIPQIEIGVDFIQPFDVKGGKLETKFGIGVSRSFGHEDNYTTARMKNSTDFNVVSPEFNETKLLVNIGLDYEKTNGIFYNTGMEVSMSKETKKEYNLKVGAGYRF